jgi:glycosyltransferase involved in cell wall biosynthesis
MTGLTGSEMEARIDEADLDHVFVEVPDLDGTSRSKQVDADHFRESWGRSTVEAMLTGAIPLVPAGHHLENLLVNGESGFVCQDFKDYRAVALELFFDRQRRRRMSKECRRHAEHELCDASRHLEAWREVFQ